MSKRSKAEERAAKAAAALAERRRRERRRNILVGVGVVVVMTLIVGIGFLVNSAKDDDEDQKASDTSSSSSQYQLTIGPDDAPHTIVFYEDFLCPICQAVEDATRDEFARLADAGKVQVSYRPFNLFSQDGDPRKPYSVDAAEVFGVVLEKSGAEVAKKLHDLLYQNQPSEGGPFPDQDDLVDLAGKAGADEAEVRAGLDAGDGADWVEGATAATDELGIDSTPTIYLDGSQFQDYRTLQDLATNLIAAVS